MKIFYSLITLLCAALFVTGCGDKSEPTNSESAQTNSSTAAQANSNLQEKLITDFFNAVAAGQDEQAVVFINIPADANTQPDQTHNKLKALVAGEKAKIDAKGGLKSVQVKKASDAAAKPNLYEVVITFSDNSTEESIIELFPVGDNWKIQM